MNALTQFIVVSHQPRLAAMQRSLILNLVRGLDMEVWVEALDMMELWGHKTLWELLAAKTRGDKRRLYGRR